MSEHVISLPLIGGDVVTRTPADGGGERLVITGVGVAGEEVVRTHADLPAGVYVEEGGGKVVIRIPVDAGGDAVLPAFAGDGEEGAADVDG